MNRLHNIQQLQNQQFDLCIIGGGASGAGCALDAALRGLKVALIDQSDFAAETSSKSTKLVHGGVRYLEQAFKKLDFAQLRQVRHGLEERHIVLANAPHLARPLGLITPVFSWWEGLYFSIGLQLYDWFASGKDQLPESRWLSKKETLSRMPGLSHRIHSAILYYDGQLDDARYCLALAHSADEAGAVVANYIQVTGFQKDSQQKIEALQVLDKLDETSFLIHAKWVINCTGANADHIRKLANPSLASRIQPSKGVHAVLPHHILNSADAMLIPKTKDGRVVFAVPFEGALLLGTTDDPYSNPEQEPILEAKEIDFLLETLQPFLATNVSTLDVTAGFGGLRPLLAPQTHSENGATTKTMLRDHEVEIDPGSGLLSLLGGKWTTYRLMAKDTIDAACRLLKIESVCTTEQHLLVGANGWNDQLASELSSTFGLEHDICLHLSQKYGVRALQIARLIQENTDWGKRILPHHPFLQAEVVYAVREEMVCTPRDFLARRIRLEITDWQQTLAATPVVSQLMGQELGWSTHETQRKINDYTALLEFFRSKTRN
jgi:glycerol-3-phosphate dehydrogenase